MVFLWNLPSTYHSLSIKIKDYRQPFTPLVTHRNWRKLLLKDNNYWYKGAVKVNEEERGFVSWFSMHLKRQICWSGYVYKCRLNAGTTWPRILMMRYFQKHLHISMFFFETFLIRYCVSVFQHGKCQNFFRTYSIFSRKTSTWGNTLKLKTIFYLFDFPYKTFNKVLFRCPNQKVLIKINITL